MRWRTSLDLVIAHSLTAIWMWRDAAQHGRSAVPFIVLTVLTGSFGPLLYLFRRFGRELPAGLPP